MDFPTHGVLENDPVLSVYDSNVVPKIGERRLKIDQEFILSRGRRGCHFIVPFLWEFRAYGVSLVSRHFLIAIAKER
ncbi:MAG: hypothetical protein N2A40_07040 [Desulfobulbaceae bacterium]